LSISSIPSTSTLRAAILASIRDSFYFLKKKRCGLLIIMRQGDKTTFKSLDFKGKVAKL
jgi:hypothetical protein